VKNWAAYGEQILVTVSRELTAEYGRGFSHPEITRMVKFAQLFPDEAIVVTPSQLLSWSHFHDPYLLDLFGLKGAFSERDFESAARRLPADEDPS
jgi:hypothetical protein